MAAVMITTNVCPMVSVSAASGVASLESLGKLGTVNIGSKSESGTWLQTQVDSKPVFVWIWERHVIRDILTNLNQKQLVVMIPTQRIS